jgi:hypothetical protein
MGGGGLPPPVGRMAAMPRRTPIYRRRTTGPRKASRRIGLAPVLLFVLLCALAAAIGFLLEAALRAPVALP